MADDMAQHLSNTNNRGEEEPIQTNGDNAATQVVEIDAPGGNSGDASGQAALLLAAGILPSTRSPSSTLAWLMVVQVQFLAVLSLVDSVGTESSWLSNFLENLR